MTRIPLASRERRFVLFLAVFLCLLTLGLAPRAEAAADTGGDTGFEICTVAASCQAGAFGTLGGELAFPKGVAADPAGNVYVVDGFNRIQKFDSSGIWERAWGRDVVAGGDTKFEICTVAASCKVGATGQLGGELFFPTGVAADAAGNVYVADDGNNRIQKFDSSGNWERTWGRDVIAGGGTGFEVCTVATSCKAGAAGQLGGELSFTLPARQTPAAVAADPTGSVYVAEAESNRIQKFDSSGNWERAWGRDVVAGGGTGFEICTVAANCKAGPTGQLGGELSFPAGVAADAAGKVYVADDGNNRIQKFDSSGNWERAWGGDVVDNSVDNSIDNSGFEVCTVALSCQGGVSVLTMGGFLSDSAWVGADPAGKVYVTDHNRIEKFDSSGNWERAWGKDVVPRLVGPPDSSTGFEICTVAVSCGEGAFGDLGGEFSGAAGVAADPAGKVYVVDQGNVRIQKFDSSGNWERAWGKDVVAPSPAPTPPAQPEPSATCRGKQATIVGTEGADRITGTPRADVIAGLGGKDNLSGLAGKDVICGGKGNDMLKGGAGNDQLSGQKGNDKLYGQKGNDKLSGKGGKDTLKGGPGKDTLKGGAGKDKQVQ